MSRTTALPKRSRLISSVSTCKSGAAAVALVVLGFPNIAFCQSGNSGEPSEAIALVDVSVLSMESERVEPRQTIIVRDGRIVEIGAAADVVVPEGARVVAGAGRYVLPGLTDAHVHLEGDGTGVGRARPNFGDGVLYLSHGVTTVINLRGTTVQLDWRRRVEAGELPGPTIYTAGEFVNEPRVTTPEEVEREVAIQVREGYDLIKFHEIADPTQGVTTVGMSRAAYSKMVEAARSAGLPIVGHAPVHLGLDALIAARQPLAHLGAISNVYFLPLASNQAWLTLSAGALLALILIVGLDGAAVLHRAWRSQRQAPASDGLHMRVLASVILTAWLAAFICAALFLPGGPLFDSTALRLVFTALAALAAGLTIWLVAVVIVRWRASTVTARSRTRALVVSLAALVVAVASLVFWVPVAWRSSDAGINRIAMLIADADIPVQTTLVAYDAIGGPGRRQLIRDPAMSYLEPDVRARWIQGAGPPGYRYTAFMQKVAGALHAAGVSLMAGTDAMGFPRIVPGASLHQEFELLIESGLTPHDVLRASTVVPARFLNKQNEFGTVSVGKRADLILVDANPLEGLGVLADPAGVMARGRWFSRADLRGMLATLTTDR
jgi:imidazolonepropionase-like amidohydrolase